MRPDGLVHSDGSAISAGTHEPSLQVPDGIDIFAARFARDGDDLVIAAEGSPPLTVTDYFGLDSPPALAMPNGAMLRGDVVELLAGPRAPAQYAQAEAPEGAVAIGQVETLTGTSTATRVSGETVELGRDDPVFQGDVIETAAESTLGIRLEDGTLASMSAQSRLVLNEFVFETGGSDNWMVVDLVQGAFAFLTGAIAPSGGMEITTPVAVMAIRGTMPVAFVAGESGASQFFAASDEDYELLHLTTREVLTIISSEAGFALDSPDAPLRSIELDPETLNEIDGLLDVLNETAADLGLLGIQSESGFQTWNGFGSIDGNFASLIEFMLLLEGALNEEAVLEVEDPNQFMMAEAELLAAPDQAATDEMSPVTVNVLDNDSHPDDDALTVVFADVPNGQGSVSVVDGQFLEFHPGTDFDYLALGETTDVVITYVVSDSTGAVASSTVTVTLTGINQAPVVAAVADTNLDEQTDTQPLETTITVDFTDIDLNNVGHEAAVTGVAVDGVDGGLTLSKAQLIALVTPGTVTKSAGDNTGSAVFDFSAASTVFDYLVEGQVVTLTYTVEIDDGDGGTTPRTFDVVITGTNDAPVIDVALSDVAATVVEDGFDANGNPLGSPGASGQIDASDVDNGGTNYSVSPLIGTYGVLTVSATGAWTYVLNDAAADPLGLGESDVDVFTVTVTDGFGASDEVEVTLTVTGANDGPAIVSETTVASGTVNELVDQSGSNHQHVVDGTISFADVDVNDTHTAAVQAGGSNYLGEFVLGGVDDQGNAVGWTFTVTDADLDPLSKTETRIQTYTVTIDDGNGGTTQQVVTITLNGSNDAPVIEVGDGDSASADLDETDEGLTAEGTLTVSDVSVSDVVTATVSSVVASGDHTGEIGTSTLLEYLTVTSPVLGGTEAEGTLTWTFDSLQEAFDFLADGEELVLTYTVTVDDGTTTSSLPVTITIAGTNDAPVITIGSGDSAADGLTESDSGLTTSGTLSVSDLDISDTVSADVTKVVVSGTSSPIGNATLLSFLSVTGTVVDGATAATVNWSFDSKNEAFDFLAKDDKLVLTYTVLVDDGNGGTDAQEVVVTITGTNDAPVIDDARSVVTDTVVEDGLDGDQNDVGDAQASGQVRAGDVDDGAVLTYSASTTAGTYGTFAVNAATGVWTYTLDDAKADTLALGDSESEVFTVTVTDEHGASDDVDVVVTVTGSNDAPQTDDVSGLSGYAGSAIEVTLSGSDVDGTVSFFKITSAPTNGGLFLDPEGLNPVDPDNIAASGNEATIYFIPDSGASGDASFDYAAVDNFGAQDQSPATVEVTVETATLYLMIHQDSWQGGADLPTFDGFQVTIGGIIYDLGDLTVVASDYYGQDGEDGFTLGVGTGSGGKERFVVFEIDGVPGAASAEISFDYKITDPQGDFNHDGIRFYAGDSQDDMVLVYDGDQDRAFTGNDKNDDFSSRVLSFNYAAVAGLALTVDGVELTAPLDPIILDLGAPGIDLSGTTTFDLNADGQHETLAWTGGDDGILVMDVDGSGAIEGGHEVFSPFFDGGGFADALEALESLDSSQDGVIDARDEAFADLLVWVDANSDGQSQSGELFSLADLGIDSLGLGAEGVDYQIDGQQILAEGQFTYTDGSIGDYVAVELAELLSAPDSLASDDGGQNQLFALTDLSIHEVIVDYRDGDVVDLTQLGFAVATGQTLEEFVQYDSASGEVFVDVDGAGGQAGFELAAELATPPPSVLVRFADGDAVANVEIA